MNEIIDAHVLAGKRVLVLFPSFDAAWGEFCQPHADRIYLNVTALKIYTDNGGMATYTYVHENDAATISSRLSGKTFDYIYGLEYVSDNVAAYATTRLRT